MTTNLEQIAKQVSLLNRLIELLRMQEEPSKQRVYDMGWKFDGGKYYKYYYGTPEAIKTSYIWAGDILKAWTHPVTQKAWSDELVKVTRELHQFERTDMDFRRVVI
jgi:hypothetical protein